MNTKEIVIFGKALKALLEAGLVDQVKDIVDYMASEKDTASKDNNEK